MNPILAHCDERVLITPRSQPDAIIAASGWLPLPSVPPTWPPRAPGPYPLLDSAKVVDPRLRLARTCRKVKGICGRGRRAARKQRALGEPGLFPLEACLQGIAIPEQIAGQ